MKNLIQEIKNSGLFDTEWYLKQYPDVIKSELSPIEHYLKYGYKLNRQPSKIFDAKKYLEFHKDVALSDINPLAHYIQYGKKEGRAVPVKKIEHEKKSILNKYFDKIYLVNLDKSKKERLTVFKHLHKMGVKVQRWNATNGYKGNSLTQFNEYKKRQLGTLMKFPGFNDLEIKRGKGFIESPGAFGYIHTYLSILNDAKVNHYDKFLIIEDDIILCDDFDRRFETFISSVDKDWKVLQLGASQYGWNSFNESDANIAGYYHPRRLDTCGSFAIAFSHDVIDELIELESAFEAPFDHLPMGEIYEKYIGKCYVCYPNIVMPDVTDSNIRGGRDQFLHGEKMKWRVDNFQFPLDSVSVSVIVNSKHNLKYASQFSCLKRQFVNIRLFASTSDGLRPIHNFENLDWIEPVIHANQLKMQPSDFYITLDENYILSEDDLFKYISSKYEGYEVDVTGIMEFIPEEIKTEKEKFSVIISTYKRPTNLYAAVRSAAEQDYVNKEIIVVNDTGPEEEYNFQIRAVVNKVRQEFTNVDIKLIEHSINRNGSSARNTGFLSSSGEYISFLDDDDIYLPGRLTKTVENLKCSGNHIGATYCGFLGWNSPENNLQRYTEGDLTKYILLLDYFKHYVHTNTVTYKRSSVLELNGFDESYRRHQDLEFNIRFFQKYIISATKEALVRLNPAPSDISNKVFDMDMALLKNKFLNQFSSIISDLGEDVSRDIYSKHIHEVVRYIRDKEKFNNQMRIQNHNVMLMISNGIGE
ncbi:glycosyltransferase [Aeromonas sp. MdU4]|uniref:glycosyltransferase n=1 Tax=Aeromonas sp. MdU4 TaxID=3342819 RepID=UPI0035BA1D66